MESSEGRRAVAGDAVLYGISALFAGVAAVAAAIPQYREWGRLAVGTYAAGAAASLVVGRRPSVRTRTRTWLAAAVFVCAAVVPMALEVTWRSHSGPGFHAQSEVLVTEEAAKALLDGRNPYTATFLHGSLASRPYGTKTHFPYLPGMAAFGLPRAVDGRSPLADARVWFGVAALGALWVAVRRLRAERAPFLRCAHVLFVLPTGALFLATGGDDLPVLALMLASVLLLRRGRPGASGVMAGLAVALKQTAWPLLPFLLVAAGRDRRRFALPAIALPLVVTAPFFLWDPMAFVEDVIRFPLGLGKQASAAGTPTVGSLLVRAAPVPRGVAVAVLAAAIGAIGAWLLLRPSTRTLRGAVRGAGLLYLFAVVLAPSGRAGYLLYPVNLLMWAWLATPEPAPGSTVDGMTRASRLPAG